MFRVYVLGGGAEGLGARLRVLSYTVRVLRSCSCLARQPPMSCGFGFGVKGFGVKGSGSTGLKASGCWRLNFFPLAWLTSRVEGYGLRGSESINSQVPHETLHGHQMTTAC